MVEAQRVSKGCIYASPKGWEGDDEARLRFLPFDTISFFIEWHKNNAFGSMVLLNSQSVRRAGFVTAVAAAFLLPAAVGSLALVVPSNDGPVAFMHPAQAMTVQALAATHPARVAPTAKLVNAAKAKAPARPSAFDQEARMSHAELMNRWNGEIGVAAERFGVPQSWLRAVMAAESGGRTMSSETKAITSSMGAQGLMQLMPQTYADMRAQLGLGPNAYDPHDNITASAAYLRWLDKRYGYPEMFAAYNDGPGNLEARLVAGRMLPLETQLYVGEITGKGAGGNLFAGGARSIVKFTRPDGASVAINAFAVAKIRAPLPDEYAPSVRAVIMAGKASQGVEETVAQATQRLRAHGARV
jgi:soluble lytic murein transglycosylase-like protein